jgi:hypothetical protein
MSYIIVSRNLSCNKLLVIVDGEDGEDVAEFATKEAAEQAAENTMCCRAWGYEILEVAT